MSFKDFIDKIEHFKQKPLGGLEAQFKMAPKMRLKYDKGKIIANNPKKAAVLALFYPNKKNEITFLLTKRASYKGTHSAQISFPGGKLEKKDKNLQETAIREAFEEVGTIPSTIEIIRKLTDVYIPPSNFLVSPFLGFTNKKPYFTKNYEVAEIIEISLSDLLDDAYLSTVNLTTSYMKNIDVPCFKFDNQIIWGATAMMLSEIKELLK
jgi:8-oxo-dGTP pyrophosphatase MutT (NUDIX family)